MHYSIAAFGNLHIHSSSFKDLIKVCAWKRCLISKAYSFKTCVRCLERPLLAAKLTR